MRGHVKTEIKAGRRANKVRYVYYSAKKNIYIYKVRYVLFCRTFPLSAAESQSND